MSLVEVLVVVAPLKKGRVVRVPAALVRNGLHRSVILGCKALFVDAVRWQVVGLGRKEAVLTLVFQPLYAQMVHRLDRDVVNDGQIVSTLLNLALGEGHKG